MHTLERFRAKRILLLQGPLGPFFSRLASDLQSVGATVFKINFCAGDEAFYPKNADAFRGPLKDWPQFLEEFIVNNSVEFILLFGDCRPRHRMAIQVAQSRGLRVGVFEEGYVRPNFITLDWNGANAYSLISRDPQYYLQAQTNLKLPEEKFIKNPIYCMIIWSYVYYFYVYYFKNRYPLYEHHRPINYCEGFKQVWSFFKKWAYRFREQGTYQKILTRHSENFFLVALQVHNDAQLLEHSESLLSGSERSIK